MSRREKKKQYDKNSHILLEDTYEIDIRAINLRDVAAELEKEKEKEKIRNDDEDWYEEVLNVKPYRDTIVWAHKIAVDILFEMINLIKHEMSKIWDTIDVKKSIPSRTLAALTGNFISEFTEGRDMEEVLLDYIEDLKEFNFYPPIEDIKKKLWKLRSHKIDFFKKVLEEYHKDIEGYNRFLKASAEGRKADINRY